METKSIKEKARSLIDKLPEKAIDNPLVDIAGKFGGEFWHLTQSEIERSRKTDREETNKLLDSKSDKQD